MDIQSLNKEKLIALEPQKVDRELFPAEIIHIAKMLGAYWGYDYEAAKKGLVGLHAELKSKRHSDGFFVSKIMLKYSNICKIMADQMALRLQGIDPAPEWVAGIPDGATELGRDLARILNAKSAKMQKVDGKIQLLSEIPASESLLLCEDFCTKGTGFKEAVWNIKFKQSKIKFVFLEPVIINRGELDVVEVTGVGSFKIVPLSAYRVNDWAPEECPLCKIGSKAIKPKVSDDNWRAINSSQGDK